MWAIMGGGVGARFIAPWGGEGFPHVPLDLLMFVIEHLLNVLSHQREGKRS